MKIITDALPFTQITTGIQRYARCLYTELAAIPGVSVCYFGRSGHSSQIPPVADPHTWAKRIGIMRKFPDPVIVAGRILDRLNFERRLKKLARRTTQGVYHDTAVFPPAGLDVPVVSTVHDISLIKHPERHPRERVWFSELFFKRRLAHAAHVITVSEFTRGELIEETGIAPQKVTTVHLAQGAHFFRRPRSQVTEILKQRGWPEEYVLFVGTLEPRKNIQLIIEALPMLKHDIPLLLTGWSGWGDRQWWDKIGELGLQKRVILTGYVDEETLACLYAGAAAFVYPSIYEGFGLPVLEAMACGCPVLCSNTTSLPEVAGDAALLVDPHDPENLAHELEKTLCDSDLRESMISAGLQRAALFSWKKTALETWEIFNKVLG